MSTQEADLGSSAAVALRKRGGAGQRFGAFLNSILLQLIGFASLFLVWHIASVYIVQSLLFPPPLTVLKKGVELTLSGVLIEHTWVSLRRIAIGFILGSVLGIPVGMAIGSFPLVRKLIEPWTEFLRFIPSVAMITIAVIWFGIGEESKIFLIIYTTIFIVIINTAAGVSAIAPNKIRAAQALGASPGQIFFYVGLPATVPFILTGMRLAMANSFTTIVAAELISANEGLGVMLWNGRMYMLIDEIFVSLVCLGMLGFATDRLFRWAIYRFAGRFAPVT
ncbi:MAG: ABC transporter permease [Rhizobiales bacterium]|jgi:NitT/TauT family transport system permease protein|nr:ABC transporter permease [Hyphomicrobiales bacterium]